MRILHFADLHLGIERYGHISSEGLSTRFEDFLSVLDEVVDFALKGDIDLVLFCGDAYKNQHPDPTQQREFAKRIARIAKKIPIFLLIGNHDLPHALGKAATTEIFDALSLENVIVARRPDIYLISTKRGNLQILALPWARQSALLEKEEAKDLTIDQIYAKLQEKLTDIIRGLTLRLNPEIPAILAGHFSLDTAKPGSERTMLLGKEPVLLQSNIANPIFSYIALGHIHNQQVLSYYPPIVYSGSLERLDFSDERSEKGFYIAEIDRKETKFSFHPVKARRFLTLKFSIEKDEVNPMEVVLRKILAWKKEIEGAIVRVQIDLPSSEIKIDTKEIRRALSQAYFVLPINIKTETRPIIRLAGVEGLSPIDALRFYLEKEKKFSPEYCRKLLEYGEKLIEEAKK